MFIFLVNSNLALIPPLQYSALLLSFFFLKFYLFHDSLFIKHPLSTHHQIRVLSLLYQIAVCILEMLACAIVMMMRMIKVLSVVVKIEGGCTIEWKAESLIH